MESLEKILCAALSGERGLELSLGYISATGAEKEVSIDIHISSKLVSFDTHFSASQY